jgi:hypothetical protein
MTKSRGTRWADKVACSGEIRNAHKIVVLKPEGKITLERHGRRCEDNIKMYLREI